MNEASKQSLQFAANVNDFTFNMYREAVNKRRTTNSPSENTFISPKVILDNLSMVYAGTKNETAEGMQNACFFPVNPDQVFHENGLINVFLSKDKEHFIRSASGIWAQEDFTFNSSYLKFLKPELLSIQPSSQVFGAEFKKVNYTKASHAAIALGVNQWIEETTDVKNLASKDCFAKDSVMSLFSAASFKGKWETGFKETPKQLFIHMDGTHSDCRLMTRQASDVKYFENDTFKMVDLPFAGDQVRMAILLPWLKNGLGAVEKWLTSSNFNRVVRKTVPCPVSVIIPKWKTSTAFDLKSPLCNLGMEVAFSDDADFSGMTDEAEGLKISGVFHKASIEVSEKGEIFNDLKETPARLKIFRAEHPFAYVIHHIPSGMVLFTGSVRNPEGYN